MVAMNFILLPGKNPPPHLVDYHRIAFNFWFDSWTQFFKDHNSEYKLNPDDFFRQDFIGFLVEDQIPLAIQLYSIFDISLSHQRLQTYCHRNFTPTFYEKLAHLNLKNTISIEWMIMNSNYRKIERGRKIPTMVYAGGIQLTKSLHQVDAIMASARNDIGVTRLAQSGGCETVEESNLHGFPVSLIVGKKENLHLNFLDEFEKSFAINIFNSRSNLDLINNKQAQTTNQKAAA